MFVPIYQFHTYIHTYIPLYRYTYIGMISVYTYYRYRYRFDLNPKPDIGIGIGMSSRSKYWYRFAVYRYDYIGIGIGMAISVEPYWPNLCDPPPPPSNFGRLLWFRVYIRLFWMPDKLGLDSRPLWPEPPSPIVQPMSEVWDFFMASFSMLMRNMITLKCSYRSLLDLIGQG